MTTADLAKDFTAALKAGKFEDAERFWSDDVVSIEAQDGPMKEARGRAAVHAKGEWWTTNHDVWTVPVAGGAAKKVTSNAAADMTPMFSPDGRWIGFFARGKLKKIAVTGGAPVTLADAMSTRGGAWGEDDTIIAGSGAPSTGLLRIPASGGPFLVRGMVPCPCMRGRCSSMVNRVVRSTSVPIAEFDAVPPMMRSPSQWPGTARSSTVAGRWLMLIMSGM